MEANKRPTPSLSILIVTWNSWSDLRNCLESIYASDFQDFEIVVIDNASVDETGAQLPERFPDVVHQRNDSNLGHTRAVNKGLKIVRGRDVLLLDVDVELEPDTISELMAYLAQGRPDVAMVVPRLFNSDGTVQEAARSFPTFMSGLFGRQSLLTQLFPNNPVSRRYLRRDMLDESRPYPVEHVSSACMFFERALVDEVGLWDEGYRGYWVDADWCMALHRKGKKIICLPTLKVVHHEGFARWKRKSPSRIWMFHMGAFRFYRKWHAPGALDPRALFAWTALAARAGLLIALDTLRGLTGGGKPPAPAAQPAAGPAAGPLTSGPELKSEIEEGYRSGS